MKNIDPGHYDIIASPSDRTADRRLRAQQGGVQEVASKATKPQIKGSVEKLFDVKAEEREHAGE